MIDDRVRFSMTTASDCVYAALQKTNAIAHLSTMTPSLQLFYLYEAEKLLNQALKEIEKSKKIVAP